MANGRESKEAAILTGDASKDGKNLIARRLAGTVVNQ